MVLVMLLSAPRKLLRQPTNQLEFATARENATIFSWPQSPQRTAVFVLTVGWLKMSDSVMDYR